MRLFRDDRCSSPMSVVELELARVMGTPVDALGDSTGVLEGLG